jgi:poly-gamma-glutamate capsule biosynthesis protein CapA/YwtB (metallophosphatase superfamily)
MPDLLTLAAWSRWPALRHAALRRLATLAPPPSASDDALRLVFTGDVMFDPAIRTMWHLGLHKLRVGQRRRTLGGRIRARLSRDVARLLLSPAYRGSAVEGGFDEFSIERPEHPEDVESDAFSRRTQPLAMDCAATGTAFPFERIAPLLRSADVTVANLETPLTDCERPSGLFKSRPGYARAMRDAGVTVANLANNHVFDAGEAGFTDTLRHLADAAITPVGVGRDCDDARAGVLVQVRGATCAFLGYTQFCNSRFASLANGCPGLLPLDRRLMVEDVRASRRRADLVIVSVHWGFENQPNVHPRQVRIAHDLIDAGADAVIGHHAHVPHGVEVYRGRPVVYSLGNFIFAQRNHPSWGDNFVVELVVDKGRLHSLLLHPIGGRGNELFQPTRLEGARARNLLELVSLRSAPFRTPISIEGNHARVPLN